VRERIIIKSLRIRGNGNRGAGLRDHGGHCRARLHRGQVSGSPSIDADRETMTLIEQGSGEDPLRKGGRRRSESAAPLSSWRPSGWPGSTTVASRSPAGEFLEKEARRLSHYVERFAEINHPHTDGQGDHGSGAPGGAGPFRGPPRPPPPGHGDYPPQERLHRQDRMDNWTPCMWAIDSTALCAFSAFDVGPSWRSS